MGLHTTPGIPNPDVVHMFVEEVGCAGLVENVLVDTMKGGNRSAEFLKVNPLGEVPALDLGNGKMLSESIVICKYLNEMHGGSSVVGTTAEERADADMWMMRAWDKVMAPMMVAFQAGPMFNFFKDRRPGCIHKE